MAADDPKITSALVELDAALKGGQITAFEHHSRRKVLLRGELVAPAAVPFAVPPDDASKTNSEAPAPSPLLWGNPNRAADVKHWNQGARGDDPSVRVVHAPLADGIGSGKVFFFLFGFRRASEGDQLMLAKELAHIDDDIEVLRKAGYAVIVDPQATREDFVAAVGGLGEGATGLVPAGMYWSAHGSPDGALLCCDGNLVRPSDLDPVTVAKGLRLVIFGACYVGSRARSWKAALGGHPLVVGWGRSVLIDRVEEFLDPNPATETGLDDLIARYLLVEGQLPADDGIRLSPLEDTVTRGRLGNLPIRIRAVVDLLGARFRECDRHLEVEVPLEEGRHAVVQVFLIDSAQPFSEGQPLLAVECDVGELSAVVETQNLLAAAGAPGYARVVLLKSDTEAPRIVVQGFLPLAGTRDQDFAGLIHEVAACGERLTRSIFGGR